MRIGLGGMRKGCLGLLIIALLMTALVSAGGRPSAQAQSTGGEGGVLSLDAGGQFVFWNLGPAAAGDVFGSVKIAWLFDPDALSWTSFIPALGQVNFALANGAVLWVVSETPQDIQVGQISSLSLLLSPSEGPSGTIATVTVTGAEPRALVTVRAGAVESEIPADATGTVVTEFTMTGDPGTTIIVSAASGLPGEERTGTATFLIPAEPEEEEPDGEVIVEGVSVTLSPSTGLSGTEVVVTVSGAEPGEPITIILPAGAEAGVVDAAGTYTTSDIFLGDPGDVVIVTVILGAGQATATFTISA